MARLEMWVVYDRPRDHPEACVARRWVVGPGTTTATRKLIEAPELEDVREQLRRKGLVRVPRQAEDDPVIVEVWL